MALIDLKTNLKDLSYVDPNFKNTTGAPYVYKDHTDYESDPSKLKASNEIQARIDETVRIAKLLIDNPGLKFAGKQAAILAAKNLLEDNRLGLVDVGREVASLLASVVAQVPINGTGVHFDKYELYNSKYYISKSGYNDALYRGKITIKTVNSKISDLPTNTFDDYELTTSGSIDDIKLDTVPVYFSPVGSTQDPLLFRGFISSISDNTSPSFNSYNFVGRGEPVHTYMNTNRTLSFSLQVPVFSKGEQGRIYQKASQLISFGYPKYNENNLPEGTLIKLKIGDLYNIHGVFTSINHTIDTNVPWSVGDTEMLLPQVLNFSLSLNIIHNKLPQRGGALQTFLTQDSRLVPAGTVAGGPLTENGIVTE